MIPKTLCGCCKIDVTPPVGYYLCGHSERNKPSEKVHDPLYVKILGLATNRRLIFFVTSDLVYFPNDFVHKLRKKIKEKLQLEAEDIILTASHTHTGPFMEAKCFSPSIPFKELNRQVKEYSIFLEKKIINGIIEAHTNMEEVRIKYGKRRVNIGIVNRRLKTKDGIKMAPNFKGFLDEELNVLGFKNKKNSLKAILFNYTCHPTTLSSDIYEISADYPGVAQREIENYYKGATALFTNGCCGDVRPAIIKNGSFKRGTFSDIERMGKILSKEAIKVCDTAKEIECYEIRSELEDFNFYFESRFPFDENVLKEMEKKFAKIVSSEVLGKWRNYFLKKIKNKEKIIQYIKGDIHVIKIGNINIIGLPGEVMVGIGLRIKEKLDNCIVMGYSNGEIGYIPTSEALSEGGYETASFFYFFYPGPYSRNNEEKLIERIVNIASGVE